MGDHVLSNHQKQQTHENNKYITAKQYLRDHINKNTADPVNDNLKNYEKLAKENVTNNHDSQGAEDTYMKTNNDTQHSNIQENIVNRIPTSCK